MDGGRIRSNDWGHLRVSTGVSGRSVSAQAVFFRPRENSDKGAAGAAARARIGEKARELYAERGLVAIDVAKGARVPAIEGAPLRLERVLERGEELFEGKGGVVGRRGG